MMSTFTCYEFQKGIIQNKITSLRRQRPVDLCDFRPVWSTQCDPVSQKKTVLHDFMFMKHPDNLCIIPILVYLLLISSQKT